MEKNLFSLTITHYMESLDSFINVKYIAILMNLLFYILKNFAISS